MNLIKYTKKINELRIVKLKLLHLNHNTVCLQRDATFFCFTIFQFIFNQQMKILPVFYQLKIIAKANS